MFEQIKLMARLAGTIAALQRLKSEGEKAKARGDWGRCADLIDEAMPHLLKVRDELRAVAPKK